MAMKNKTKVKQVAKKPVGRTKSKFTQEQIAKIGECAFHGCQTETIATLTGIPASTLRDNFRGFLTKKRAERKLELRKAQDKEVSKGNSALLIFLGKNELEQTDKQTQVHELSKETITLLGLIDGSSKGKLPTRQEIKKAGK